MKKFLFIISLCGLLSSMTAQTEPFTHAFPVAGSTENNTYVALGLPFYEQISEGNVEVDFGVAHALLITTAIEDETCQNVDYTENSLNLEAPLEVGTHEYPNQYVVNGSPENYDLRGTILLTVYPTYDVYDTMMFHGELPTIDDVQLVEGDNVFTLATIHDCDSLIHLYALLCPYTVNDVDNTEYNTVVMNERYCWTQSNLQTEHFADNSEIPGAFVYTSTLSPDAAENLQLFGRLYTWYSAMNISEDGSESPETDENGFTQGICPEGWHVPTAKEMNALFSYPAADLNSLEEWFQPNHNTNSTNFSLLPAGYYDASIDRFENLHTYTYLWSSADNASTSPLKAMTMKVTTYCEESMLSDEPTTNAYSVRCVKNY